MQEEPEELIGREPSGGAEQAPSLKTLSAAVQELPTGALHAQGEQAR
jgi:hypothetical protein